MKPERKLKARHLAMCALFSALIAIGAFIQIPVPFMDYFTLQFLFVILSGMLLGARRASISVGVYVAVGLCGIPVFAAGGGPQYVLRPSFGYLLGFIAAAAVVGLLCRKLKAQRFPQYFLASLGGLLLTYTIGFAYKYLILNCYLGESAPLSLVILSAFPLDLPGDVVLCVVGSALAGRLSWILRKENLL